MFSYIHRLRLFFWGGVQNLEFQYFWFFFQKTEYFGGGGMKIL